MTRTARVILALGAILSGIFAARAAPAAEIDSFDYLYVDPYRPRFVAAADAAGARAYRTRPYGGRSPERFALKKPPGTRRVFVVGGSIAQLYDGFGPSGLKTALELSLPGRGVEAIKAGSTAYDSARDAMVVQEILSYEPDLIVVMSGVNERQYLPPAWLARADEILRPAPPLRAALRWLVLLGARMDAVYGERRTACAFEKNVRGMVRAARARGVPVVLCTLPVNLRDMPPRGTLPFGDPAFSSAWRDWERGPSSLAAAAFERYSSSHPDELFSAYYLGRCRDRLGDFGGARAAYLRAWDRPRGASMPALNELLRRVAREEGAGLADLEKAFADASPQGLVGRNLMEDDVHWDRAADPLVGAEIARAAWTLFSPSPGAAPPRALADYASRASSGARALRPSKKMSWMVFRYRAWDSINLDGPLFSERELALLETIREANPALLADAARLKEWIRGELAANIWDAAVAARLDEWWPVFLAHVGETYRRRGEPTLAAAYFARASRLRPELGLAPGLRALVAEGERVLRGPSAGAPEANAFMLRCVDEAQRKRWRDALRDCGRTVDLAPERLDVLLDALCAQGAAHEGLGDAAAAAASWGRALSLAPADWPRGGEIRLRLGRRAEALSADGGGASSLMAR